MLFFKIMTWTAAIAVGIYLALLIYLYFNQKSMIFFPRWNYAATPDQFGLIYDEVILHPSDSESIHGWYFPSEAGSISNEKRVVLFCHGNAGNISHRISTAQTLVDMGSDVFMFDYRGYGRSVGETDELSTYQDARICYDWLIKERGFLPDQIVIMGRSLGGAVGIELASKVKCRSLIVESSFTSAGKMGQKLFPFFPVDKVLKYKFNSIDKIDKINCPLMIIHSPEDDIIPYQMGIDLFEKAHESKKFLKIFGGHNDRSYLDDPGYIESVKKMIFQ